MHYVEKILFSISLYICVVFSLILRIYFWASGIFLTKRRAQKKRIFFIENQPKIHSGHQYRVEIVVKKLKADGWEVKTSKSFTDDEYQVINKGSNGNYTLFIKMIFRKLIECWEARNFDLIIVRRELLHHCHYGGLFFEKLLLAANPNVILDMDDYMPIMKNETSQTKFSLFNYINFYVSDKAIQVLNLYPYYTVAGNGFIDSLLEDTNSINIKKIHLYPMCVDYGASRKNYLKKSDLKRIGWVSHSQHFSRIANLIKVLSKLSQTHQFELVVSAERDFEIQDATFPITNIRWSLETEVETMLSFHIGIAPIFMSQFLEKKKGTFKLNQYMALGLVSLSSNFFFTRQEISEGENGFLANTDEDWLEKLKFILDLSESEMQKIGTNAYESFYKNHHIDAQYPLLRNFYERIINQEI